MAVEIHLGGMLTEKLALVGDSSGASKEEGGVTLQSVVGGRWPGSAVLAIAEGLGQRWVGAGVLTASGGGVNEVSDPGLGFLGGIGVDVLQKKRFAIDLQARFTTAKIEGERTNNVFALVGFNFY